MEPGWSPDEPPMGPGQAPDGPWTGPDKSWAGSGRALDGPRTGPPEAFLCRAKETPSGLSLPCQKKKKGGLSALQENARAASRCCAKNPGGPGLVEISFCKFGKTILT